MSQPSETLPPLRSIGAVVGGWHSSPPWQGRGDGGLDITIEPRALLSLMRRLAKSTDLSPTWLSDLWATPKERGGRNGPLELHYWVRSLVAPGAARVRVQLAAGDRSVPSVAHRWPSAAGAEHRLSRSHDLHFRPVSKRRIAAVPGISSLQDSGGLAWESHQTLDEPCGLPERPYEQMLPLLASSWRKQSVCVQACFCRAVEALLGWSVPPRAVWLRMIACEWERMVGHAEVLAAVARRLGASTAAASLLLARQEMQRLRSRLFACRFGGSPLRIGGLVEEPKHFQANDIRRCLRSLPDHWNDAHQVLHGGMAVEDRLRGRKILPGISALKHGMTGPVLRASGVDRDLRAKDPYEFYGDLPLRVCTRTSGDAWDRVLIRFDEISESMNLIEQCLEQMEEGPVLADEARLGRRSTATDVPVSREALDALLLRVRDGLAVPRGEAIAHAESVHGEWAVHVHSDGERTPLSVHVRSPVPHHWAGLAQLGLLQAERDAAVHASIFGLDDSVPDL